MRVEYAKGGEHQGRLTYDSPIAGGCWSPLYTCLTAFLFPLRIQPWHEYLSCLSPLWKPVQGYNGAEEFHKVHSFDHHALTLYWEGEWPREGIRCLAEMPWSQHVRPSGVRVADLGLYIVGEKWIKQGGSERSIIDSQGGRP